MEEELDTSLGQMCLHRNERLMITINYRIKVFMVPWKVTEYLCNYP